MIILYIKFDEVTIHSGSFQLFNDMLPFIFFLHPSFLSQLHCKTDKHLQRLQLVNHIREGGKSNEWRLKYSSLSNPVQVKCNACDYYTNSVHKLQLHATNGRHEANAKLYRHLQSSESLVNRFLLWFDEWVG